MRLRVDKDKWNFFEEPVLINYRWSMSAFWHTSRVLEKGAKVGSEVLRNKFASLKENLTNALFLYGTLRNEPIREYFYPNSGEKVAITWEATSGILRVPITEKVKFRMIYCKRRRLPSLYKPYFKNSIERGTSGVKYGEELWIMPIDFNVTSLLEFKPNWVYPPEMTDLSKIIASQIEHTVFSWKNYVYRNSPDLDTKIFRAGKKVSSFLSLNEEKFPAKRVLCIIPIPDT